MKMIITVKKMPDIPNPVNDNVANPEESLDIVERLRLEARTTAAKLASPA